MSNYHSFFYRSVLMLVTMAGLSGPAFALTMFKCTTMDGRVTYQDHRPETGECKIEETKLDLRANIISSVEFEEAEAAETAQNQDRSEEISSTSNAEEKIDARSKVFSAPEPLDDTTEEALRSAEVAANATKAAKVAAAVAQAAAELAIASKLEADIRAAEQAADAARIAADVARESADAAMEAELEAEIAAAFAASAVNSP